MTPIQTPASFDTLLREMRRTHMGHPALHAFCVFPTDLAPQDMPPRPLPCTDVMRRGGADIVGGGALRDAMLAAGPDAWWRDTYAGTTLGADFMDRFGCYCVIGENGAWTSATMNAWVIHMPAGFWYPWHHHAGEEMYLVVGGEAEFLREGEPSERLGPGDTMFHASNQPHAMRTRDRPVLTYVIWRNHLGIRPVLAGADRIPHQSGVAKTPSSR